MSEHKLGMRVMRFNIQKVITFEVDVYIDMDKEVAKLSPYDGISSNGSEYGITAAARKRAEAMVDQHEVHPINVEVKTSDVDMCLSLYQRELHYGGPEEGGWDWHRWSLIKALPFPEDMQHGYCNEFRGTMDDWDYSQRQVYERMKRELRDSIDDWDDDAHVILFERYPGQHATIMGPRYH